MVQQQRGPLPPEEQKRTEIALFRYRLIAPLIDQPLARGELAAHLRAIAKQHHQIPYSQRTTINADTVWSYFARFRRQGFEGLKPQPREDAGKSRRIPEAVIQKAIALREEAPTRSTPMIIAILRRDPAVPADLPLKERTLRDILLQRGKSRQQLASQSKAFRRFEREAANVLWQGDMLVGPYLPDVERPGKSRRTALFCFIDDYSRLIPYGEFFLEESLPRLERVLQIALLRRGLPQGIFVDNAKVYTSIQLAAACASLGIQQIHSTPYTPNTRGKIERFFGTVRSQFLTEAEAAKVATLAELNDSFQAWVEMIYHRTVHSETEQTPLERFRASIAQQPVRPVDATQLRQALLWREKRTITRTATVSLQGNRYGVDPFLAGRQVELRFDPFDLAEVELWQSGHFLGHAQVQKLERARHLSLDRIPAPAEEAPREHVDFLAALRAEHKALLAQELGTISFAQALRVSDSKGEVQGVE
ncbi:MAG: DDE-type integrase/transposase/recombinase [Dehalococcoidia bacterium]|nr:DDE-type integrase/transposase/recombinase [Dehalococcoidia bacterium]